MKKIIAFISALILVGTVFSCKSTPYIAQSLDNREFFASVSYDKALEAAKAALFYLNAKKVELTTDIDQEKGVRLIAFGKPARYELVFHATEKGTNVLLNITMWWGDERENGADGGFARYAQFWALVWRYLEELAI